MVITKNLSFYNVIKSRFCSEKFMVVQVRRMRKLHVTVVVHYVLTFHL